MARKKTIPDEIRAEIMARVEAFNQATPRKQEPDVLTQIRRLLGLPPEAASDTPIGSYIARFQGVYLYLDRIGEGGQPSEICRLKWTGDINDWEFAIYRHSRNFYDPDEWLFPGSGEVDGTVEGAMRAGLQAYPD